MDKQSEIWVTTDFFGGRSGLQSILNDYYENEVTKLNGQEQKLARIFLEEGLIVAGKRVLVSEGVEKANYDISSDLLKKLLNSRLIRAEITHLGKSYEVSHDALVEPILTSLKQRKQKEEQQAIREKLLAEQQKLKAERHKRRQITLIAIIGFALFAGTLLMFLNNQKLQKELRTKANELENTNQKLVESIAREAAKEREKDSINYVYYLEIGLGEMEKGNYKVAIDKFESALRTGFETEKVDSIISEAQRLTGVTLSINQIIQSAEIVYNQRNYFGALKKLDQALVQAQGATQIQQIREIRANYITVANNYYRERIQSAQGFLEVARCQQALTEVRKVEKLAPYLEKFNISEQKRIINTIKNSCPQSQNHDK